MKFLILTLALTFAATKTDDFQIHKFETQTLKNGLTVLWVPDQTLPYTSLTMMVKSGSSQDPMDKAGLASFTASMLNKGTTKHSAVQISDDLEQMGSGFDASVEPDYTMASTSSLSFNRDEALKQFSEILLQPSFTNAEIERYRKQMLASFQKMADRPEEFATFLLPNFMYGSHPYGHGAIGIPHAVRGFKRNDLQKFYTTNYQPSNAVLAVVGQYDDAYKQQLLSIFEGWKGKPETNTILPEFPAWKGREFLLVDRSDLNQAQIEVGFKGVPRDIPEYMELRAALKILGESFGSRLFEEIRVKRGLTYHINAWFDPRLISGPMGIYTFTRADKIGETVEETLKTYKKFVTEGVTDNEVGTVKALMRGQFPRLLETPEGLAHQLLLLNRYGISTDYLTQYLHHLELISKNSVNATIKKYFDADNLRVLVYAPKAKAEESLRKLGKLEIRGYKEFLQ